ncbi:tryptophan 7-halogenase [Catenulispora sp. NF23]|uniref:NAD(P)/FAD-dependent oxidoreductase n=1 Tax=Catenulispora pinistramenti TaxID=2705254 RepID=UPI001BA7C029|nr:tryptophan 7-halogenase [Catenulispora pinistramenti]MBS2533433.1 tryptophan 7-halogenase [Catenulispora pinistramenti]
MTDDRYDVAILGSGIGGSMLACILARHGVRTLLLEGATHPRFTIGESLIPETGIRLRIIGEKYGVPEIGWIGAFHKLRDNVSSNCGVKRSFSFMYHSEGREHRAGEVNQLPTLTPPIGPDSHLFRQDVDAYLAALSIQYGAAFRQGTRIEDIKFGEDEVELHAAGGVSFKAKFLIDASGMRSMVSDQLGLRDETPRFKTDTRTLYTHMMNVPSADLLLSDPQHRGVPSPLGQATMHHIFDGGWIWVIPFNNHRQATNPLTSVGMMLDRRKHPDPQGPPEEEFRSVIARFPTIRRHFDGAVAARPWIGSGRLQYSSPHLLGPRVLQLPHAAAFVDPLFSSGMSVLTVAVDLIAERLLRAVQDDDFATERFQFVEDVVNTGFDHYDMIVSGAFDSFASYDTWNAWNRNWALGNMLGAFGPLSLLIRYLQSGDPSHLAKTTEPGRIGVLGSHLPNVVATMRGSQDEIEAATRGEITHAEAGRRIFARLGDLDFVPKYMGFGKPEQGATATFTLLSGARHVTWYRRHGTAAWKENCTFPLRTYAREAFKWALESRREGQRRGRSGIRDILFADNQDWRHLPPAMSAHGRLWPAIPPAAELAVPDSEPAEPTAEVTA